MRGSTGNLAFGAVVVAAAAWLGRRSPAWLGKVAFLRHLGDDLTGRRLAAAAGFLDDIAAFEGEG